NSWWFGLKRMLLGYATGSLPDDQPLWQDIAPYDEVAGLQAQAAGKLVRLIETVERYWQQMREPATPTEWIGLFQSLLDDFFVFDGDAELALQQQLLRVLEDWRSATEEARFDDAIDAS